VTADVYCSRFAVRRLRRPMGWGEITEIPSAASRDWAATDYNPVLDNGGTGDVFRSKPSLRPLRQSMLHHAPSAAPQKSSKRPAAHQRARAIMLCTIPCRCRSPNSNRRAEQPRPGFPNCKENCKCLFRRELSTRPPPGNISPSPVKVGPELAARRSDEKDNCHKSKCLRFFARFAIR